MLAFTLARRWPKREWSEIKTVGIVSDEAAMPVAAASLGS